MKDASRTRRDALVNVLSGRDGESVSVLCPGGMMSFAVSEVMEVSGAAWPDAHLKLESMLRLALAMQERTGFDAIAMPFCMTVEAEGYGAAVILGSAAIQPRLAGAAFAAEEDFRLPALDIETGRRAVLIEAIRVARAARPDVAVMGNVVGPFSTLAALADPLKVLRWARRAPERLANYLETITADLARFARAQVQAGADAVCISEPTATGEILGGAAFGRFVLGNLNRLAGEIRGLGAPAVVHVCGNTAAIEKELFELEADAVSFDSMVNIVALNRRQPPWRVMGNVSPFLLASANADDIRDVCKRLLDGGIRLLAPGCGVVTETPVANLRAMADARAARNPELER
jgi:[methyl-Co(III) methanol-specific corrinoid protein]:coenzyme M methyltransferase